MKHLLIFLFCICFLNIIAQENEKQASHTFYAEGFGSGGALSVHYDKIFNLPVNRLYLSTGLGFNLANQYLTYSSIYSMHLSALLGADNNFGEVGFIGQIYSFDLSYKDVTFKPMPFLGYRHQPKNGGLFYRAYIAAEFGKDKVLTHFTPLGITSDHGAVKPYLGLNIGYTLPAKNPEATDSDHNFIVSFGLNSANFKSYWSNVIINGYSYVFELLEYESKISFTGGVELELPKNKYFSLIPGVFISNYKAKIKEEVVVMKLDSGPYGMELERVDTLDYDINLLTIELPLTLRFYPLKNLFVGAGPHVAFNVIKKPSDHEYADTDIGIHIEAGKAFQINDTNKIIVSAGYSRNRRLTVKHPALQMSSLNFQVGYAF